MNITWFIGNGFDSNLGLKTSYPDFRERVYLSDSFSSRLRDDLLKRINAATLDEKLDDARLWSDLERLLGEVSKLYGQGEEDEFSATFEEMEKLLAQYVRDQELRIPDDIPEECIEEFRLSIGRFDYRMTIQDRRQFNLSERAETISHRFVTLNYTRSLERFIERVASSNGVFMHHRAAGREYSDIVAAPFHLHNSIDANGNIIDVVFGIDSKEQLSNEQFAQDSLLTQCWVKGDRNTGLFGNDSENRLQELIGDAEVICIYGCSMGETDGRIWRLIGDRLIRNASVKLVLFAYGLPDRHGSEHMRYQRERETHKCKFLNASCLKDTDTDALDKRIYIVSSGDYFKFGDELNLGDDGSDVSSSQLFSS